MNEIKRYKLEEPWTLDGAGLSEHPDGEWIRLEDVMEWLKANSLQSLEDAFYEASKQRGW